MGAGLVDTRWVLINKTKIKNKLKKSCARTAYRKRYHAKRLFLTSWGPEGGAERSIRYFCHKWEQLCYHCCRGSCSQVKVYIDTLTSLRASARKICDFPACSFKKITFVSLSKGCHGHSHSPSSLGVWIKLNDQPECLSLKCYITREKLARIS